MKYGCGTFLKRFLGQTIKYSQSKVDVEVNKNTYH